MCHFQLQLLSLVYNEPHSWQCVLNKASMFHSQILKFSSNSHFVYCLFLCKLYYQVLGLFRYFPFFMQLKKVYVCLMYTSALDSQRKVPDPLELELQVLVSSLMAWVLGTELCLSGRPASTLDLRAFLQPLYSEGITASHRVVTLEVTHALYPALHNGNILQSQSVGDLGYRYQYSQDTGHFYFIGLSCSNTHSCSILSSFYSQLQLLLCSAFM